MSESNEQVCLLAFNIFGVICSLYSALSIYDLQKSYQELGDQQQENCTPYLIWKVGFLVHIIFFFICLSFSVGVAQDYLDEEDNARAREPTDPRNTIYMLKFDKMIENSLDVMRMFCLLFCGPFILVECLLSLVYFSAISEGCPEMNDPFTSILIYVILVMGCVSLAVTGFCCYSSVLLGKAVADVWPQLRSGEIPDEEEIQPQRLQDRLSEGDLVRMQAEINEFVRRIEYDSLQREGRNADSYSNGSSDDSDTDSDGNHEEMDDVEEGLEYDDEGATDDEALRT